MRISVPFLLALDPAHALGLPCEQEQEQEQEQELGLRLLVCEMDRFTEFRYQAASRLRIFVRGFPASSMQVGIGQWFAFGIGVDIGIGIGIESLRVLWILIPAQRR